MEGKRSHAQYCSDHCRSLAANRRRYHADLDAARSRNRDKYYRIKARRENQPRPALSLWERLLSAFRRLLAVYATK